MISGRYWWERKEVFGVCFLAILILAGWLRFGGLDERPMHTDEAVLGVKLEEFLESGTFFLKN